VMIAGNLRSCGAGFTDYTGGIKAKRRVGRERAVELQCGE
jgi:hypothetical protein